MFILNCRPLIELTAPVFHTNLIKNIKLIEEVQKIY